jgi:hypothetical protein
MLDRIKITDCILRAPREDEIIPNQHSCHEFGMPDTSQITEDEQMEYFADILLEWYFKE